MNLRPYARRIAGTFGGLPLIALLAAFVVLATAMALYQRAERETLDDLGAVPHTILASLPVAANAAEADTSALRLACIEGKALVLVLRTKLAVGKNFYAAGQQDRGVVYVDGLQNRLETRMTLVRRSTYDTLVSTPLSATALTALGSFFGDAAPKAVTVVTLETHVELEGQVGRGQISAFAADCRA